MAIPLYVPEEYGPSPSSSQQTSSLSPSPTSVPNCASFVHQLIVELYSIYRECCAANASANADGRGRDVNNNSTLELAPLPHRRRRHPAGASGTRCSPYEMVPLPALMASDDDLHRADRQQHSEFECKLTLETNFGSIGLQLRQIADSYTAKRKHGKDFVSPFEFPEDSHSSRNGASWHSTFKLVGSFLFLSFSVTATVVFIKSK